MARSFPKWGLAGVLRSIRKSWKLARISGKLARQLLPLHEVMPGPTDALAVLDELYELCNSDLGLRVVLDKYAADRDAFIAVYSRLLAAGAGQWAKGHYVAASALAFGPTLDYVLRNLRHGMESRTAVQQIAFRLITYFEKSETGWIERTDDEEKGASHLDPVPPCVDNTALGSRTLAQHEQRYLTLLMPALSQSVDWETVRTLLAEAHRAGVDVGKLYELAIHRATHLGWRPPPFDEVDPTQGRRRGTVVPDPLMLEIATPDGELRLEFADWACDVGPLEAETLVPVWWPHEIDGNLLSEEDRARAFAAILISQLQASSLPDEIKGTAPTSPAHGLASHVIRALVYLRPLFEAR